MNLTFHPKRTLCTSEKTATPVGFLVYSSWLKSNNIHSIICLPIILVLAFVASLIAGEWVRAKIITKCMCASLCVSSCVSYGITIIGIHVNYGANESSEWVMSWIIILMRKNRPADLRDPECAWIHLHVCACQKASARKSVFIKLHFKVSSWLKYLIFLLKNKK